ncbi:MAG TPA: GNAT family N-acetyltransferase [Streptosporangiaceae bacterium]|jgi:GNAT superfamily N-acetyltransferase
MGQIADVEIRPFAEGDRDAVMGLAERLTEGVGEWREPASVLRAARGWVSSSADKAADGDRAFYVAVAGSHVIGLVTVCELAHFTGQVDAYVGELVVSRGWEGRGAATRLMAAAEGWAARRGLTFIRLGTGSANKPARGLYASLGYAEELVELVKPVAART